MSDENRGLPTLRGRDNAYNGNNANTEGWQTAQCKPIGVDVTGTYTARGIELYASYEPDFANSFRLQGSTLNRDAYIFPNTINSIFGIHYYVDAPDFTGGYDSHSETGRLAIFDGRALSLKSDLSQGGEHSISARVTFANGEVGLITAYFNVSTATDTRVNIIQADRNTTIAIKGQTGQNAPDLVFNLSNTEGASATYSQAVAYGSAEAGQTWLNTSTLVGSVLTLKFTTSALAAGAYSATVTVTATGMQSLVITIGLTVTAAATYQLVSSSDAGFANPAALEGAILTGTRYIGFLPTAGVSSVLWSLDGTNIVTRTGTPFDFGAEAPATSAALYDTSVLANGSHTLSATITPTGGQRNYILQSQTLSTSPWSNFTTTVTTGTTLAGPEGSTLMLIKQDTGGSAVQHTHSQLVTKPSAASLQWQVKLFIKPDSTNPHYYFRMIVGDSSSLTGYCSLYFRLDPGNVGVVSTSVPAGGSSGWSVISSSVTESSTAGIYVVSFVGTSDAAATLYPRVTWTSTAGGSSSYAAGTATGALMAWQLDFGSEAMTTYTTTTTAAVIGTGGTPTTLSATFSTQNAAKELAVDKAQIVFNATAGGSSPAAQTLTLSVTAGTAAWASAEVVAMDWLSVTASGSSVLGTPSTVTFTPTLGSLSAGQYSGSVQFTATGYTPITVSVILNVQAALPTYDLYYSPNGVGVAPMAKLQAATTGQLPYVWLANTASTNVPIALAGTDTFSFWNSAITIAQEATVAPVRTVVAPNNAFPAGGTTGQQWEASAGLKNYHWVLTRSGVVSRGDAAYTYGSTSTHKNEPGMWMRAASTQGLSFNTAEQNFLRHPECKGAIINFRWNQIEQTRGVYTWTNVDNVINTLANTYGKKAIIIIGHQNFGSGGPPAWMLADTTLVVNTGSNPSTFPNWRNPTAANAYKSILRAFSDRYDNNENVIGLWTDEAWLAPGADSGLGTEAQQSAAYYALMIQVIQEIPKKFQRTHLFCGGNFNFSNQAPGGSWQSMVDAGLGLGTPDPLNTVALPPTQRLMTQYRGQIATLLFGDSWNAGDGNAAMAAFFPNKARATYKYNVDWAADGQLGAGAPNSAQDWGVQYCGVMAYSPAARFPPIDPGWVADHLELLDYVRARGFKNTAPASNLVKKL